MRYIIVLTLITIFLNLPQKTLALKTRVRNIGSTRYTSYSSAKLSRPSNSVNVTFLNLPNISKINYELSYTANGIPQGAMGTVVPTGTTDSRSLYFGTCSKGVCTPHYNITAAKLTVKTTLKNGSTNTKLYRIKI